MNIHLEAFVSYLVFFNLVFKCKLLWMWHTYYSYHKCGACLSSFQLPISKAEWDVMLPLTRHDCHKWYTQIAYGCHRWFPDQKQSPWIILQNISTYNACSAIDGIIWSKSCIVQISAVICLKLSPKDHSDNSVNAHSLHCAWHYCTWSTTFTPSAVWQDTPF